MDSRHISSAWLVYSAIRDRRRKYDIAVEGIGGLAHTQTKGSASLTLRSIYSSFTLAIEVLVLPTITSILPARRINISQWKHLVDLELADPHFGTPGGIDVLLGADVWGLVVENEVITGTYNEPCAQRTRLGWVVFGPASSGASSPHSVRAAHAQVGAGASLACNSCCSCSTHAQVCADELALDKLIQNFWKLEEVPEHEAQDDDCERFFASTHSRTPDGRYMVRIPFCHDVPDLGESYTTALRQFHCLERRLASNNELREKYVTFMREYSALGHMERLSQPGDHTGCYYIPHHAVTSKFRVVFNASAQTNLGVSLNDVQLVGPTIQDSLINIIFRFRRFRIALTADIEKMFRQVLVAPEDRNFQRILWRETTAEPIGVYHLTTVTYGMACSPYNAVRALHQCANDNYTCVVDRTRAVAARDAIWKSFYVDDFLTSCNDTDEAATLAADVDTVLSAGKFKLRKWNSNDAQVIQNLTGGTSSSTELVIDSPTATVLGLRWDPVTDELFFNVSLESQTGCPTKRQVLSEVSKLFDPTGLVAPVVIIGKMFIQTLWVTGLKWDAALPDNLRDTWLNFRNGLDAINCVRVSRWLGMMDGETTELHGFCDASSRAYAAVIYTKTIDSNKNQRISLLTARTKVAPIKGATIPRLELCAAHLLAVTLDNVRIALGLTDTPYFLWSDSRIVLCWLRKQPTTLKPYVSNRVRQIQELTSPERWNHVRSAQNPADCASRGMGARELLKYRLWWHGPEWLMETPVPSSTNKDVELHQDELRVVREEEKVCLLAMPAVVCPRMTLTTRRRDGQVIAFTEHFSSLSRLLHSVVRMLRWSPRRRHLWKLNISADELNEALDLLIRLEQATAFPSEIHNIQSGLRLPNSSRLLPLNPFMDHSGILRVGGRLTKAAESNDFRFPIILPRRSAFTWLLIQQAHQKTLHGGTQLMLHHLRTRYWILHARQAVRGFIHRCVICRRSRGATLTQQMASLPKGRVTAARPFLSAGVDYCGPFTLRIGSPRSRTTVKTYLAIFVCMATKAVHIEVVDDLSSQAFLDAYTRFVSRRGLCRDLHSDNGTAFVGANRMLQEDLAAWHSDYNQQALADIGTNWHFITPSAPHQGGLWEAAVKSAKRHLVRLVGGQAMWYNQLHTLAARIEACLNSRPLVPLHDDPEDKFALTPGDFLIGAPLLAVPEPRIDEVPANRIKQWQWLRQVHQRFWQRWSEEYLVTLQTRSKWQKREDNIKVGDIVLIRQDNLPPTHWRLGRVTEVHPGSDGLTRNASIKTAAGVCTRAVQKLCRLLEAEEVKADEGIEPDGSTGQDV